MNDKQWYWIQVFAICVLLIIAVTTGDELYRLRLENEHLKAEITAKSQALLSANAYIAEMEAGHD